MPNKNYYFELYFKIELLLFCYTTYELAFDKKYDYLRRHEHDQSMDIHLRRF